MAVARGKCLFPAVFCPVARADYGVPDRMPHRQKQGERGKSGSPPPNECRRVRGASASATLATHQRGRLGRRGWFSFVDSHSGTIHVAHHGSGGGTGGSRGLCKTRGE